MPPGRMRFVVVVLRAKNSTFRRPSMPASLRLEPELRVRAGEHVSKFRRSTAILVPLEAPRRALSERVHANGGISKSDPNPSSFRSTGDEMASKFEDSAANLRKFPPQFSTTFSTPLETARRDGSENVQVDRDVSESDPSPGKFRLSSPNVAKCSAVCERRVLLSNTSQSVLRGVDDIFPTTPYNARMRTLETVWVDREASEPDPNPGEFRFPCSSRVKSKALRNAALFLREAGGLRQHAAGRLSLQHASECECAVCHVSTVPFQRRCASVRFSGQGFEKALLISAFPAPSKGTAREDGTRSARSPQKL